MGSQRFPGKVLHPLFGKPLLEQQLKALKPLGVSQIIIATSTESKDDSIEEFCKKQSIQCVRGDEEDVLSRYITVAQQSNLDHIVRLTGDNPIISYHLL